MKKIVGFVLSVMMVFVLSGCDILDEVCSGVGELVDSTKDYANDVIEQNDDTGSLDKSIDPLNGGNVPSDEIVATVYYYIKSIIDGDVASACSYCDKSLENDVEENINAIKARDDGLKNDIMSSLVSQSSIYLQSFAEENHDTLDDIFSFTNTSYIAEDPFVIEAVDELIDTIDHYTCKYQFPENSEIKKKDKAEVVVQKSDACFEIDAEASIMDNGIIGFLGDEFIQLLDEDSNILSDILIEKTLVACVVNYVHSIRDSILNTEYKNEVKDFVVFLKKVDDKWIIYGIDSNNSSKENNSSEYEYENDNDYENDNYDENYKHIRNGFTYNDYSGDDDYSDDEYYDEYILPYSDSVKLTESDLYGMTAMELTYARNEIYARHGYVFDSSELQDYFESTDWYEPDYGFSGKLPKLEQKS